LQQTGGNVVRAAQLLGLSRNALRYRMSRYGIGRPSRQAIRGSSTASSEHPIPHSEPISPPVDLFPQRTPFVARERELAALHERLGRVLGGQGQVVGLVGEPGVGKSRLLHEFQQGLAGQRLTILAGRCVPYGNSIPYLPMRDLLKAYFGVGQQEDGRAMRQKMAGKLLSLDRTLAPMLPPLLALLGETVEDAEWQALDPLQRRQQILDAVARVLQCESRVQPLLLVIEDLHWSDPATQGLLNHLPETLATTPLFLLLTYALEYQPGTSSMQLRIDPLPVESAQALVATLLGHENGLQPLTQLLLRRTEGNPLFLVESVRTLVETKILLGERGAYRLAPTFTPLRLLTTVEEALAARIDRLPPEEKRILQTAAVIGLEVPVVLLQAIVELPMEVLQAGLTHLQAVGLLDERRPGLDLSYSFQHPLTYEVAYESLPPEQRRVLHARIVEASEQLSSDRLGDTVERLAQHALQGAIWAKAVEYLQRASDRAAALSVPRQAVVCLEQGLMALQHLPETRETREQAIDLRLHLSDPLLTLGELGRDLDHLRQAEPLAESLDDYRRLGQISVRRSFACWLQGEHRPAIPPARRALAIARALGDFGPQVRANLCLGQLYLALGDYQQALK
ncbi:MAG: AAA family ATPase, partial [Candidatus Entotheonellia bacterium]